MNVTLCDRCGEKVVKEKICFNEFQITFPRVILSLLGRDSDLCFTCIATAFNEELKRRNNNNETTD